MSFVGFVSWFICSGTLLILVYAKTSTSVTAKIKWIFLAICFLTQFYFVNHLRHNNCIKFEKSLFGYFSTNQSVQQSGRTLYVITATYPRPLQLPELTRLSQTLMLVPDLVWIVVDDAKSKSDAVEALLRRTGLNYVYLTVQPTKEIKKMSNVKKPRGAVNKNRGLDWLRANASTGVFYFADDDNTYDVRIFDEMRSTQRVSMWPVGMLAYWWFESPIVRDGALVGFYTRWNPSPGRTWAIDHAGYAVSVKFLLQRPTAKIPYVKGYEEDGFFKSLSPLSMADIELKANNCTQILVWHTQTNSPTVKGGPWKSENHKGTNLLKLYSSVRL